MKRPISGDNVGGAADLEQRKKSKMEDEGSSEKAATAVEDVLMDENLLFEVLKHVDARTLAWAACVSKQWNRTAQDERLWELMCNKDDGSRGHYQQRQQQLRAVVLALGGFRRLYSLHLWPLVKISSSSPSPPPLPSSAWPCLPAPPAPAKRAQSVKRLGKDEMNLSLSLFSIQYFAKMNFSNRNKGT